jgi:transposase
MEPANITMLPLLPKSPELNTQENIWQYLRQTFLSNRVFASYEAILDACQTRLVQPHSRGWTHCLHWRSRLRHNASIFMKVGITRR